MFSLIILNKQQMQMQLIFFLKSMNNSLGFFKNIRSMQSVEKKKGICKKYTAGEIILKCSDPAMSYLPVDTVAMVTFELSFLSSGNTSR